MAILIFISTLICLGYTRMCNSNQEAAYCLNDLKCCDDFGNCGTSERTCRFYAKNCKHLFMCYIVYLDNC